MTFSVALNNEVKKQGVQKAIFFMNSPIIMDFRMKSSRKIDTIASQYRSPFSRKRAIVEKCYDITFNNIKNARFLASRHSRRFMCIIAPRRWNSLEKRLFLRAQGFVMWYFVMVIQADSSRRQAIRNLVRNFLFFQWNTSRYFKNCIVIL